MPLPSVPLEGMTTFLLVAVVIMSLGHKIQKIVPELAQKWVNFQLPFLNDYLTFNNDF